MLGIIGKILAAMCCACGSFPLTFWFGPEVMLVVYCFTVAAVAYEFINEDNDYDYCEYRDRFVRNSEEGN